MKTLCCILLAGAATGHAVVTLETEHVDLSVNFSGSLVGSGTNPWLLTVRDEDRRDEFAGLRAMFPDPDQVLLAVADAARVEVPDDPRYTAFLGPAGTPMWILPQTQDPSLLYAGMSTENKTSQSGWTGFGVSPDFLTRGVPSAVFKNNQITLSLDGFSGPGDFYLYSTSAFGDPTIVFNTSNGLDLSDSRLFSPGSHVHFNWAFSEPGEYEVSLRASGTLNAGNQFTESDVTTFRFLVVPEPAAAACAALGAVSLLLLRRPRKITATKTKLSQP
jgi:surface-anchored protein